MLALIEDEGLPSTVCGIGPRIICSNMLTRSMTATVEREDICAR